jgi:hypothetical protein
MRRMCAALRATTLRDSLERTLERVAARRLRPSLVAKFGELLFYDVGE